MDLSPGVRAVYLTAEALGVNLQHVETNFVKNETLQPEFMKVITFLIVGIVSRIVYLNKICFR